MNGQKENKITVFSFFDEPQQSYWTEQIKKCDWGAALFLAELLENGRFHEALGEGRLFIMAEGDRLVSFATLTQKDCVDDDSLFPWIGFVFTSPEYRGHRYSGKIIDFICEEAKKQGFGKVYLATGHIGLYEKYGFSYIESRIDVYNEESRIYCRSLRCAEDAKNVLKNFLDSDGRLITYPAKRKMKLYALVYLSGKFEKDRVYTEKEVNSLLNEWHTFSDPATLRRELYNHRFLNRDLSGEEYRLEDVQPSVEDLEKKYG
ncbi:MAG: GNAT family N-acetyltransferase [Oscillospiraceae bacterium]